ncbi:MAG TPA: MmcQ/YjbR family DNA-binding protein [Planctomycetota bacterium]|nr:MmcQ/YjbR family DNA-binding protein [Planctomycetota bacterium]
MTPEQFRRLALSMPGAVEGEHHGHPDFRANGRIFATLLPDGERGMVRLSPQQQREIVQAHAGGFVPANGAWGRAGCTYVRLEAAAVETLRAWMTLAWQEAAQHLPAKPAAKAPRKRPSPVKRPAKRTTKHRRTRKSRATRAVP